MRMIIIILMMIIIITIVILLIIIIIIIVIIILLLLIMVVIYTNPLEIKYSMDNCTKRIKSLKNIWVINNEQEYDKTH